MVDSTSPSWTGPWRSGREDRKEGTDFPSLCRCLVRRWRICCQVRGYLGPLGQGPGPQIPPMPDVTKCYSAKVKKKRDLETWKRVWLSAIQSFSKPLPRSLHLKEDQTICSWPTYFSEAHMIRHIFFDTLNPMGFNCESLPSCWTSSRRGWACCRSERWRPGKRNHVFTFGSSSSSPGRVRLLVGRGCGRAH